MPRTRWFPDARVNYAEHVLRHADGADPTHPGLHYLTERSALQMLPLRELASQVRRLAERLRTMGVQPGDRVVAYLPNVPACAVAMLAVTSIGAVWSSAAIEFGARTAHRHRSLLSDRAQGASRGRRLSIRRQVLRSSRRGHRDCTGTSQPGGSGLGAAG